MTEKSISTDTVGASAGLGTVCVALANGMDATSSLKAVLMYGAPTITLASGWVWATVKNMVLMKIEVFNAKRAFENARKVFEDAKKRGAPPDQMEVLEKALNELETQQMEVLRRRAKIDLDAK